LEPLANLGLWGDLDEVDAIRDGFEGIGLTPPWDDAQTWVTVGDLWKSVRRIAPELAASTEAWDKFRRGVAEKTGVDWSRVTETTALIDGRGANPFTRLWTTAKEWFGGKGV
jgi:hypothetical protein